MLSKYEEATFVENFCVMKTLLLLLLAVFPLTVLSQGWAQNTRFRTGTWTTANVKYELAPRWNVFAEGQFRSQELYNDFNYWEFKGYFHYKFTDQLYAGAGVGTYHQYADYENFHSPQRQKEYRFWAEMFQKSNGGRVFLEHRYRAEIRYISKLNAATQDFYTNYDGTNDDDRFRFRYRLQAVVPINHKQLTANTLYFNISDEVHFTQKLPYFNQNRFFTGLGYKFEHSSIQAGVMHQFLNTTTARRRKDYLQITYAITLKRNKG